MHGEHLGLQCLSAFIPTCFQVELPLNAEGLPACQRLVLLYPRNANFSGVHSRTWSGGSHETSTCGQKDQSESRTWEEDVATRQCLCHSSCAMKCVQWSPCHRTSCIIACQQCPIFLLWISRVIVFWQVRCRQYHHVKWIKRPLLGFWSLYRHKQNAVIGACVRIIAESLYLCHSTPYVQKSCMRAAKRFSNSQYVKTKQLYLWPPIVFFSNLCHKFLLSSSRDTIGWFEQWQPYLPGLYHAPLDRIYFFVFFSKCIQADTSVRTCTHADVDMHCTRYNAILYFCHAGYMHAILYFSVLCSKCHIGLMCSR